MDEPAAYPYMDEFTIDENLLGLAIGARGSNLSAAKAIRGVLNVDLNDSTNTFYIGGEVSLRTSNLKKLHLIFVYSLGRVFFCFSTCPQCIAISHLAMYNSMLSLKQCCLIGKIGHVQKHSIATTFMGFFCTCMWA